MTLSEFIEINRRFGLGQGQQVHPCSGTSDISTDVSFPNQFREVSNSLIEKAQVQLMVRSHLKSLWIWSWVI